MTVRRKANRARSSNRANGKPPSPDPAWLIPIQTLARRAKLRLGVRSRSPFTVGARNEDGQIQIARGRYGQFYLLGLMHGHFEHGAAHVLNAGIGIVIPVSKILEVINQPDVRAKDDETDEEDRKRRLPVMDTD